MYRSHYIDGKLVCVKPSEDVSIPADPENTDYQRYLEWLAEGNEPEVIELSV